MTAIVRCVSFLLAVALVLAVRAGDAAGATERVRLIAGLSGEKACWANAARRPTAPGSSPFSRTPTRA